MYRLDKEYVDSCAYHEAGHTAVAVSLGMPLRNRGVHIDTMGNGISYYWFRIIGDGSNAPSDILERERTIIAGEAGFIAQKRFYCDCVYGGNWFDRDQTIKLLNEMYPNLDDWIAAQDRLVAEARRLVDVHWQAIEALAKAVLDQPLRPRPHDPERIWSADTHERWIDGNRVISILKQFQLQPFIREESEGRFCPNLTPGALVDPALTQT
ncbi:MAG TPA: hypothetical protein VNX26_13735 [Candidatus Acidoferrum sp.]|jgi:hypothetical protein|nr:hypothetical protein [Candidatus Acidoferrum sp.]